MPFKVLTCAALVAGLLLPIAASAEDAPPAFERCLRCHRTEAGKDAAGPSLFGVVGRKVGTEPGFRYSPAMAAAGGVWDPARLAKFLAAPKEAVPGTRMGFPGLKNPEDVKAGVDYLQTLK